MNSEQLSKKGSDALYREALKIHFMNQGLSEFEAEFRVNQILINTRK